MFQLIPKKSLDKNSFRAWLSHLAPFSRRGEGSITRVLRHIQTKGLTAEIILNPLDVVLTEISSRLHLYKDDFGIADIADSV